MTHEEARLALAELLRDDHGRPRGVVAYAYCAGRYAVSLNTSDGDYVLLDMDAVDVYRSTHQPARKDGGHGA